MGEHDPLGKPRRSRGVLHVDDLVRVEFRLDPRQILFRHVGAELFELGIMTHAFGFLVADENDILQVRQLVAVEPSGGAILELRDDLVGRLDVIGVLETANEEQHRRVGLVENVLEFSRAVIGIDRNQNGADLRRGELQHDPFGDVGRPDRHVVVLADPEPQQPLRDLVGQVLELAPGMTYTAVRVDQGVVVGEAAGGILEQTTHGEIECLGHENRPPSFRQTKYLTKQNFCLKIVTICF